MFSGANKNDYHIGAIDFNRDVEKLEYADLRIVETGEAARIVINSLMFLPQLN